MALFWFVGTLALGIVSFSLFTPTAHADGGAPNLAYVSGTKEGISVIDVAQQKVIRTIQATGDPRTVALSLDARFLYVAQPALEKLSIFGAKDGNIVCTADVPGDPNLLTVDNNTGLVYVAGGKAPTVSVIDGQNCSLKRTFQVDGPVHGLALAAVGSSLQNSSSSQVWVAGKNIISIFDSSNGKKISDIDIQGPGYLAIPPGVTAYATLRSGGLVAIDLGSHKILPVLSTGKYGPMDFDAATGEIYVPDQESNRISILTPVNINAKPVRQPNRTIALEQQPQAIAITSDGQLGFVALRGGTVLMLDIPGRQSITTIRVDGSPDFIVTGVYPPALGTTPQQASVLNVVVNIVAYAFIIVLFVVPILLFRRFSRAQNNTEKDKEKPLVKDQEAQ